MQQHRKIVKPIRIFTTKGEFAGYAETAKEAAEITGTDPGNVSRCVNGKATHTGGFVFLTGGDLALTGMAVKAYFEAKKSSLVDFVRNYIAKAKAAQK